mmetsp:Transcript_34965/g.59384  ORF Transcript_34965/g.59384 Transcript_34965/m.59384 type:complete len:261 (+) Transcript_34965:189-971(+)|eukprot:CAMPEP_0183735890 /NCGR_PEP_ID=MMETSP0737-20130205/47874_1 /TAXON_ID=385413 /ORGANISM="Thalassiosira miniscula, Strain CCMP1093" /LENGTH=260 /DNA_ID=CAMNT_0025969751 /DNA_START=228 /DNA_END=1010 /DNA_ORIENTATION=+
MELNENVETKANGIPPIITAIAEGDERSVDIPLESLQVGSSPTDVEKPHDPASNEQDESTAGESYPESSHDCSDSDSDDESIFSIDSHHTNDSTRLLLQQAQERIAHQTVYEEVKKLRVEVQLCKTSVESALRQKVDLQNRCNALESSLAQAMNDIQSYKLKELKWNDKEAEREKDFMNQLNDACSTMEANEKNLMDEIIKRDMKIIELQNLWNEEEIKRMKAKSNAGARSKMKMQAVAKQTSGLELEDDWGDDSVGQFI